MSGKLPFDAFDCYFAMGADRSYQAVAERFGVSKRTVAKVARKEDWQGQIGNLERQARENANKKTLETLEEMADRHLKQLRVIQVKALETLKAMPLERAMDAVRALDLCMKQERTLREPTDQGLASTEDIIKREYARWMTRVDPDDDGTDADG